MPTRTSAACLAILVVGCVPRGGAADPLTVMRTELVAGETLLLANSCSKYAAPQAVSMSKPVFGSCFLTNLRLVFEESEWARALDTAASFVPTGGDFGLGTVVSGGVAAMNANYVIARGRAGELSVVERDGRIFVPLASVATTVLAGNRTDLMSTSAGERWLTLESGDGWSMTVEIYDLPPDVTGWAPDLISRVWRDAIELRRREL